MKAAFIVARYGTEINGGAELHCRMIAERLNQEWDIEVLTTCAMDYIHWSNHFPKGSSLVNGVKTRRFEVDYERPINTFNSFYNMLVSLHLLRKNQDIPLDNTDHLDLLFSQTPKTSSGDLIPNDMATRALNFIPQLEDMWLKLQGPYSSQLLDYLRTNKHSFDIFIFFTVSYCSTYFGLEIVADRSIIVPTMHREACISFDLYKRFFNFPKYILYNTAEEMRLANNIFPQTKKIPSDIVGVGVDTSCNSQSTSDELISNQFMIDRPYILYLGRIEQSKGCLDLCHFFVNYNEKTGKKLTLVFAGKKICGLPNRDDVIHAGFVSEQEKSVLLRNAVAVCIPSLFESLSMVLLEAWSLKTPTLVNGNCDVLKGHSNRGNGGFYYHDEESFHKFLSLLLDNPSLRKVLGARGKKYVENNYTWQSILNKYRQGAAHVCGGAYGQS